MKKVVVLAALAVVALGAGCTNPYIKVTDSMVIKAGQSITLQAPATMPGAALKVTIDAGNIDLVLTEQVKAKAVAQGIVLPDLNLKAPCWLIVNADTNTPVIMGVPKK